MFLETICKLPQQPVSKGLFKQENILLRFLVLSVTLSMALMQFDTHKLCYFCENNKKTPSDVVKAPIHEM